MEKIKCLILEDEPLAAEVLKDYLGQLPHAELVASCENAMEALKWLHREPVDLLFLDLHLPRIKGLDFIKSLTSPPAVIVTSAYDQYALQGYSQNVVDYLLKPVEFSRFLQAFNKFQSLKTDRAGHERSYHFFYSDKKRVKVYWDEVEYIESLKEYVRIVTKQKKLIVKYQIGQFEKLAPLRHFIRIHRSFIVAKGKIDSFTSEYVEVNSAQLPVGKVYKDEFIKEMGV